MTTFPVLARGATFANVPSPLNERHSLSLESADNCLDLVDFVRTKTSLLPKTTTLGTLEGLAKRLANTAKGSA